MVKNLPANVGDSGLIPGSERSPGEGSDNHSSVLAGKSHGGRSLAGYSPWGRKELDTKEMATHSDTLAWKIPRMEEPGGL